jgi:ABC-type proline/glycine betaine transport system permease subunit
MTITHVAVIGAGISFTGLGLLMRRAGKKKNWKAFLIGGITMLVLATLSLLFGFSL